MKSNVAREKNCVELTLLATRLAKDEPCQKGRSMNDCRVDTHEAVLLVCPGRCSSYSLSERVAENISAGAKGIIFCRVAQRLFVCICQDSDFRH
jgi:hypothetical protein